MTVNFALKSRWDIHFLPNTVKGQTKTLQRILAQVDLFSLKWITCFRQTALANKPSIWQICPHSKVELNLTTGWKFKPKKLTFSQEKVNFLGLIFQPVVRLSSTFECRQICQIDGLLVKAVCQKQVIHLSEKRSTWARILSSLYHNLWQNMTESWERK